MWTADKLIHKGVDTFVRAYQGDALVWEKTTPPQPVGGDKYMKFASLESGNNIYIANSAPNVEYSFDGATWNTWEDTTVGIPFTNIYLRGFNPNGFNGLGKNYRIYTDKKYSIEGNVMALLDGNNPPTVIPNTNCFYNLFGGSKVVSVSSDLLPATTLAENCYESMFYNCSSLENAPELPAEKLEYYCYRAMFRGCNKLTSVPSVLPATELAVSCYREMFYACESLVTAPELPAVNMMEDCYHYMFYNCYSLINPPALPATTLKDGCYSYMFYNCSNMETAPELPAPILVRSCYASMFGGCGKLNLMKCYATTIEYNSLSDWVAFSQTNGTFYKKAGVTYPTSYHSGIPTGWTVIEME